MWHKSAKNIRGFLEHKLVRPSLVWLAMRIKLFTYKRSLNCQLALFNKLKYQLRLTNKDSRSEGFDDNFDNIVHIAAFKLASPEIFNLETYDFLFKNHPGSVIKKYIELGSEYETNKSEVDALVDHVLKTSSIRSTLENHSLVKSFVSAEMDDEKSSQYYLAQAKQYNSDAIIIDIKQIFELGDQTKQEIKKLKNSISDSEAVKISFSLTNIGALISIVSAFFLITGFLYNNFLLGHFGIEVSKYFTLSDYLASSIEGIRYSALGAFICLMSGFLGMHSASRKSYAIHAIEKKQKQYERYGQYISLAIVVTFTVILHLDDSEMFYTMALLSIIITTYMVAPWISKRYFKEPITAMFSIIFISIFSAYMYTSIGLEIYKLDNKTIDNIKRYDISFNKNLPFETSKVVMIAANSGHLFLMDSKKAVYIVPRELVSYVTIHRNENN